MQIPHALHVPSQLQKSLKVADAKLICQLSNQLEGKLPANIILAISWLKSYMQYIFY